MSFFPPMDLGTTQWAAEATEVCQASVGVLCWATGRQRRFADHNWEWREFPGWWWWCSRLLLLMMMMNHIVAIIVDSQAIVWVTHGIAPVTGRDGKTNMKITVQQRPSDTIRDHKRPSETIRDHQRSYADHSAGNNYHVLLYYQSVHIWYMDINMKNM
jgi:hypothetical protein